MSFLFSLPERSSCKNFIETFPTQNYITRCPKFCCKTEIGLKMVPYSVEMNKVPFCLIFV
ncbi:hypothetical protein BWD12_06825 [Leptospira santarosai serovar Bananal]|uniref:Uncharacterized protein n=1 Tax=Leptospira santarosai TaxID=28183 RepID=A0AB73MPR9_9LEPT|nr:hypothetical protein BWD11_09710 [Leptospira santarosai serovar Grippotyphosa]ONF79938.1 hypothetical protein BWD12_06825 [Leptospira santarosai serovar Bananal]ONF91868.1 hypothetical protein BWD14_15275 [Leptospira santarosai]